jgi:hypothetical protein
MGALFFFDPEVNGMIQGSNFAEADGTEHGVSLLEGGGKMILRVQIAGNPEPIDLLFTDQQARDFFIATQGILDRIGLLGNR